MSTTTSIYIFITMKNSSGNTNTLLLVIILVLLVGFGVWYFNNKKAPADDNGGLNIEVTLPEGSENGEANQ